MRPAGSSFAPVGAALAAALVLCGCAAVPTSGPVTLGEPVTADGNGDGVVSIPRSPRDGASPSDIVAGFLLANASSANDYAIARSYLAPEVAEGWNPGAGAIVYDDTAGLNLTERGTTIVLTEPQNGTIASSGAYQPTAAGTTLRTDFTVRRVDGQWRIVGVRDGLLLTVRDLESVYEGVDRYFFNASRTALVPDRVLVPGDRAGVQTTLVRGLLSGPSSWLAPAVSTAFPKGTSLAIDSVPVVDTVATVDLSSQVLGADDAARRQLSAQLVWTLTNLSTVSAVRITENGQPFLVPGVGEVMTRDDFAGVDPNVLARGTSGYVIVGKKLSEFQNETAQPVPGVFGEGAVASSRVAVRLDAAVAAAKVGVVGAAGTVFTAPLQEGSAPASRGRTSELGSLSYTIGGDLWVVDAVTGDVSVIPPTGGPRAVRVEGAARVVVARPSRDGARAALVVRGSTGVTSLLLARVVQSSTGPRLQAPRLVENEVSDVVDVAWSDADTLVVVGRTAAESRQVHEVVVGELGTDPLGRVAGLISVAAAPGSPLLVEGSAGVWQNAGTGWQLALAQAKAPAYRG